MINCLFFLICKSFSIQMSVELLNVNVLLYHMTPVDLLVISMKYYHHVPLHTTQTNEIMSAIPQDTIKHQHKEKEQIYYNTDKEMERKRLLSL